jgi:competence protein ComFC
VCARCERPTTFETFVCDQCKGRDLGFESARAPLRYKDFGKQILHTLKYRGYARVVERLAAALMLGALDRAERFDALVSVPLHCSRLRRRGFIQAKLLARGVAAGLDAPVSDTLEAVRRTRNKVELTAAERWANVEGAYAVRAACGAGSSSLTTSSPPARR